MRERSWLTFSAHASHMWQYSIANRSYQLRQYPDLTSPACTPAKPPFWQSKTALPYPLDSSHYWLIQSIKPDNATPSLQFHYRTFNATTGCSAPMPCIGTLTLVGPPLEFLPCHQGDRFPCSVQKPKPDSRHLYAGRHSGIKQVPPELILV